MNIGEQFLKYDAYQLCEVQLPAYTTSRQFNFPDLPFLRPNSARIKAIELFDSSAAQYGPISNNLNADNNGNLNFSSLVLYGGINNPQNNTPIKQGNEIIQRVPLLRLNTTGNSSSVKTQNIFLLNSMLVDWTKSYVSLSAAPANGAVNECFIFGVYFDYVNQFN